MDLAKIPRISHAVALLLSILRRPGFHLFVFLLGVGALIVSIHTLGPMADKIHRRPLGLEKGWELPFADYYSGCMADDPAWWGYGACSAVIGCYMDRLPELYKADIAIRSTLAALLPTIMLVISPEARELIPQALVSPHRALATALFTVGAPAATLRLLKPVQRGRLTGDLDPHSHERTWVIPMACITSRESHGHLAVKLVADISILTLSATMLYQTWLVNVSTVVPWKCECPLLLFIWPFACIIWLGFSVLLLLAMAKKVEFRNVRLEEGAPWWQVLLLPYAIWRSSRADQDYCIYITARMPCDGRISLIANWRMYDLVTGVTAAAVYIYATFVLSSSLFLGAVSAYRFTSLVSALHVGVRAIAVIA